MREILFRGKRINNGEWVHGYFYKCKQKKSSETESSYIALVGAKEYGYNVNYFIVRDESVGQCSLVKDKNDFYMFEGDIIAGAVHWQERPKNGVVAFKNGSFGLIWYRGDAEQFNPFTSMCNVEYEVIGNVHDNPDLLEVSDNA